LAYEGPTPAASMEVSLRSHINTGGLTTTRLIGAILAPDPGSPE
jgi:hypothetical protein